MSSGLSAGRAAARALEQNSRLVVLPGGRGTVQVLADFGEALEEA